MQEPAFPRRKGILDPVSVLVLLILPLVDLPSANGACEFPSSWSGDWYQHGYGKQNDVFNINTTIFGDKVCIERMDDKYVVYDGNCYFCMIINRRHENVIQYREGLCNPERLHLDDICGLINSDEMLYSVFRVNSTSIPCPFNGASFTFTYNRGSGECITPISLAEKCTDESKLLLKYQACPDVIGTESNAEELQCLAVWNDGRNKYLVGTLKERSALANEKPYRCFLYEEKPHHQGKMIYLLAQSGDPTCNGLTTVSEGSRTIKLIKADKDHSSRCKYPAWVTQHHDWHSLDGTKDYHFTNKNATLKIKAQDADGEVFHEEKIVCHNLEKMYPNDNMQGNKVKLVAHVTSGCDIGYICMIFHRRDSHIIEIQQSDHKAIMPEEACSMSDPSTMPYTTLITAALSGSLHQRRCPNPGRYRILDYAPSNILSTIMAGRQRRSEAKKAKRRTWQENEDEECTSTDIQVGCTLDQTEMIISNTCEHKEIAYFCHGSWEEKGTWYTIASQRNSEFPVGLGQTFCFSMRLENARGRASGRSGRQKQQELELWLSKPSRTCRIETKEEWTYRSSNQGVCEDLTKAAPSTASAPSMSQLLFTLSKVAYIAINTLCVLFSR